MTSSPSTCASGPSCRRVLLRGARRPAFALTIDFGALGARPAARAIADLYEPEELVGLQVVAVVNLPPRRVAGLESKVLVLAVDDGQGRATCCSCRSGPCPTAAGWR